MNLEDVVPNVTTLPNGLRIVAVRMPNVHRVVLWAQVRVGSRFETPSTSGLSHFLEHMMYRGTPSHPSAQAQALAFERLGGSLGAETGADSGWMSTAIPVAALEPTIAIFSEVFQRPIFGDIEVERNIIREELLDERDDEGRLVDSDSLIRSMLFANHALGLPVGGTADRIDTFGVPSLKDHHATHYTAQGSVVAVSGPIEPEGVLDVLAGAFETLTPGLAITPVSAPPPPGGPLFQFVRHASSQTVLRVAFRAPGYRNALEPATELVLRLLDDGMSTRLYRRICDDKGLCYDVSAAYETYPDVGFLQVGTEAAHDRTEAVLDEIFDVLRRLRDEGPDAEELAKAKARHRFQLLEMLDAPDAIAEFHAEQLLTGKLDTLLERSDAIDAVTSDGIRAAAAAVFSPDALSVVAVGLQSKKAQSKLERLVLDFR